MAVPLSRPPKEHPLPSTPFEQAEPSGTTRSKCPDSQTAEKSIRELKNQLSEAQEDVRNFEHKWNEEQDMNTKLHEAYATSERKSDELKAKNKTLQNKYDVMYGKMAAQVLDVEGRRKQADANSHLALLRVQEITEDLQKCKDELFNLQPPNQVSDTHISAEWEALCSGITTWIDDHSGGIEDLRIRLRELSTNKEFSKALSEYWGEDRQLIANHYSQGSHILDELLRYNIHCFLEEKVFGDRVYMVGLYPPEAKLLLTIERKLAQLEPRRGKKELFLRYRSPLLPLMKYHLK